MSTTATTTTTTPATTTMSACDKLTMDTMINTAAYSKYMSRKDNETKTKLDETKTERRFYKKRIIELTKQLIKNTDHVKDSSVINACSAYFNACIMHFKFVDLSDTIQTEHYVEPSGNPDIVNVDVNVDDNADPDLVYNGVKHIDSEFFSAEQNRNISHVKKLNTTNEKNILEKLFISETEPVKSQNSTTTTTTTTTSSVPRVIEIDFKDRQFKTKGIKPKSKTTTTTTNELPL
jgi:hypothetical protein